MARKVKEIATVEELDKIIKRSNKKPVFLFKHDITVSESEDAFREYVEFIDENEEDVVFTVVYVREDMEVSDAVEEKLEVTHDIPQIMLIMDEEVVWDDTKDNITVDNLVEVVNEYISI